MLTEQPAALRQGAQLCWCGAHKFGSPFYPGFHKTCRIFIIFDTSPLPCSNVAEVNQQIQKSVRWTGRGYRPVPSRKLCLLCLFKIHPFLPGALRIACRLPEPCLSGCFSLSGPGQPSLCSAGNSLLFAMKGRQFPAAARPLSSSQHASPAGSTARTKP